MPKNIKPGELAEMPLEDEKIFGRNYLRELYGLKQDGYVSTRVQARIWQDLFEEMAMATIKWNGLEELGVDTRAVEYTLLHYGAGGLFTENGGFLFTQASFKNRYNIYWNPNETMLTAPTGDIWTRHCDAWVLDAGGAPVVMDADCAVCWDNVKRRPLMGSIISYADRIAKYDAVADINVEAQKTPWVIAAPVEQKRNARRWQERLQDNAQYIPVAEGATLPYTLDTKAPFIASEVKTLQRVLVNEVLTLLGIDNSPVDKRERVQTAEVISNNEAVMAAREARLKPRRQFCERANALFGTDISVEWALEGVFADIAAAMTGGGLPGLQGLISNGGENAAE